MQNTFLTDKTAADIDSRVAKILRDLDDPVPPLRLEIVRELLQLDRAYYSSNNTGVISETVHRLKVAGKQVIQRPWLLWDVVKRLELKALWVPDRKRILIDSELPKAKQRWGEAHEIGHSILPWHELMLHGDQKQTLSLACEQQIESEANYAAGRLLFLHEAFREHLESSPLSVDHVKSLASTFGNTITSTLWRAVESSDQTIFGLVSQHPRAATSPEPIRYFVRSRAFERQFGNVSAQHIFHSLGSFCFRKCGPIGADEVIYRDSDGSSHVFFVECFHNTYEALTLGVHRRVCSVTTKALSAHYTPTPD